MTSSRWSRLATQSFNSEYNALHIFWRHYGTEEDSETLAEQYIDVGRKSQLAKQLISLIADQYKTYKTQHAQNTA